MPTQFSSSASTVRGLTRAALCTACACLLAPVSIPIGPVSLTLGVFAILLAGALLPPALAALSACAYLLLGFAGLPVFAGGASTMLRLLGKYGVKKSLIVFVFSLFSLLTAAPFLIFDYHPMTMQQIAMLLLAGVSAALGQFSVTNAYAFAPAREISVFDYSQVVFSAILGFFLFQQIPDLYSLLGYLIVCGSAVGMFLRSNRKDAQTV